MQAKELRIGNLIMGENIPQVADHKILWEVEEYPNLYSPIPLDESWLERLGFEKINHIHGYTFWLYDKLKLSIYDKKTEWKGIYISHHLEFVHQVQNFVFALTGQELEITPPGSR